MSRWGLKATSHYMRVSAPTPDYVAVPALTGTLPARQFAGYAAAMECIDPTDLAGINHRVRAWAAGGEPVHPVRIARIVIAVDAIDALVDEVSRLSAGRRVLVAMDHTPMRRGEHDLKPLIENALARGCRPVVRRLPEDAAYRFHADLGAAQKLAKEFDAPGEGFAAIVSLGSGSITDVTKYARHLHAEKTGRKIPFVSFPTAASVTAYTSALAALTIDGVRRTLPALPPDIVICDLRTLADAPLLMTQAGFGDVLARSVSYGDWYLANQLGMDDGFSLVPGRLLEGAEQEMFCGAADVAAGTREAVRAVTSALLLSGMAMSIVRQTAPLSGWEHAISHFLDVLAEADGREPALHGAQVGVATLVSARAYELSWDGLNVDRLTHERDDSLYRNTIEQFCQRRDATGKLAAELWRDFAKKLGRWRSVADVRRGFVDRKRAGEYDDFIRQAVRPPSAIEAALQKAGAPRCFSELSVPVSMGCATQAVRLAHMVRARFTLGDLLSESGWLDNEAAVAALANRA
ncbi:MAG: iron-containing alcohol dehydrogenase [Phycisphaerales bacterium]|nr:MAG: iron-containing alcohol dehydrogenase [Phycisphaerales bacterium]